MKKIIFTLLLMTCVLTMAKAQKSYPKVSIEKLEYVSDAKLSMGHDSSSYMGDTVTIEGTVMFNPCWYGLSRSRMGTFICDSINGRWRAIHVLCDPTAISGGYSMHTLDSSIKFIDNFQVGNKVSAVGIVQTFSQNNEIGLLPIASTALGLGKVPPPVKLPIDSFEHTVLSVSTAQFLSGQPYEGSLVEFDSVVVTGASKSGLRFYWNVTDAAGNTVPVRDLSGNLRNDTLDNYCNHHANSGTNFNILPKQNATIAYIRGFILGYAPGGVKSYYICPRDTNDIGPVIASAPVILKVTRSIPTPNTKQSEVIKANITSLTNTVTSATLHYAQGLGSTSFTAVSMTAGSGSNWSATIPAVTPDSSYVRYWISAADNKGNKSVFPTDTAHSYLVYLVKDSGINSIKAITYTPLKDGYSLLVNDTLKGINATGIVMSTTALNDLGRVIIQSSSQPWCGLWLSSGANISSLKRGDKIKLTGGIVINTSGMTNLGSVTYSLLSSGNTLPASVKGLNIDSARLGSYNQAKAYRNMLVEFDSVFVSSLNPDAPGNNYGEWEISASKDSTFGLRCVPLSADFVPTPTITPKHGFNYDSLKTLHRNLKFIMGIMDYANSEWKIAPRNQSDIAGYKAHSLSISEITNVDNLVTKLYPNPAAHLINWAFNTTKATPAVITFYDVSGRAVLKEAINITPGHSTYQLALPALTNGIYMAQITDANHVLYAGKVIVIQ